ncbi:FlgO family outer membrane protein [Salinimonas chungwhensis]|uniref:FlgO family outer membrane protein n=1 Tax=Salinimonas chungwhensis TaxID=265425 RepID=UPI00035C8323|nr:FlgO family outer membrane protein [Salinimonas chungwhensis]
MNAQSSRFLFTCLFFGVLSGCSQWSVAPQQAAPVQAQISASQPVGQSLGNIEYQTYLLANELFADVRPARHLRYAVAGFVPVSSLKFDASQQSPLMLLGHQLEQGLITEATKRGYTTQEFKLTNDIVIGQQSDRVLSRNIEQLSAPERVDFYITGTLVHQQGGAVVNARVIEARTKDVVAAATRFFPAGLFWDTEQVTTREGRLYRIETKG